MLTIKGGSQLHGLVKVREMRKSLAEAAYTRSHHLHRTSQEKCMAQVRSIDHDKSQLPERTADILSALVHRPVNLREIETAHGAIRKLHDPYRRHRLTATPSILRIRRRGISYRISLSRR
jgi:hypothetical protein